MQWELLKITRNQAIEKVLIKELKIETEYNKIEIFRGCLIGIELVRKLMLLFYKNIW